MKRAILKTIHATGGFAPFRWANRHRPVVLTYHRFSKTSDRYRISADLFELHLDYLEKHFKVVPLMEIASAVFEGGELPSGAVAITIDDGYRDCWEIAYPMLKKRSMPATLFAITDFLDGKIWLWTDKARYVMERTSKDSIRLNIPGHGEFLEEIPDDRNGRLALANRINSVLKKLPEGEKDGAISALARSLEVEIPKVPTADYAAADWDMAREMERSGLSVESHTATHPILTNIGADELKKELSLSKDKIEGELNKSATLFCYPSGVFDGDVREAVREAGYRFGVSTEYGFAGDSTDPLTIKRIDAQPSIVDFAQSVTGFEEFKLKLT